MLRIVPDDTKFDFMRFRRISFPVSAILSIAAICLYFFDRPELWHRLHRRHADRGQDPVRPAGRSLPRCARAWADSDSAISSCSSSAVAGSVLIRMRAAAGRRVGAAGCHREGQGVTGRRRSCIEREEVVGPRVSTEMLRHQHGRPDGCDLRDPGLSLVPVRMAVRARRHDRERARSGAHRRLHVADADRLRSVEHRGAAHHSRAIRSTTPSSSTTVSARMLRRYKRMPMPDLLNSLGQFDAVALDHYPRDRDAVVARAAVLRRPRDPQLRRRP